VDAAQPLAHPPIAEIEQKVIARFQEQAKQEKAGADVACTDHSIYEELADDGSVKERTEVLREPVSIDGHIYMKLVSRNGKAPEGKYAEREKEREAKFRERLRKPAKADDDDVKLDRDFLSRFNVAIVGSEAVQGRLAWVLNVLPKPGPKPERVKMERVLNRVAGKVWVDQQDYTISKIDLVLTEPVSFYAFVGKLRGLAIKSEQKMVGEGAWVPVHTDVTVDARAMVKSVHFHNVSECTAWKPRSELKIE
jgi:hypothetical protein